MRIIDYLSTAQTNLSRTKVRTFLTVFAFVIGTFTLGMTTAFSQGLRAYLNTQLHAYGQSNIIQVGVGSTTAQSSASGIPYYQASRQTQSSGGPRDNAVTYTLNEHDLAVVKSTSLVQAAYPDYSTLRPDYIQYKRSPKYVIQLQSAFPGENTTLDSGNFPSQSDSSAGIVLPYPYVEALGVQNTQQLIGSIVTLHVTSLITQEGKDYTATVTGILPDTVHVPGAYLSYNFLSQMMQFQSGNTSQFSDIVAVTDPSVNKAGRDQIRSDLQAKGYKVTTYDDTLNAFSRPLSIVTFGLDGFAAIALLAATIGIVNTLLMAVLERTQEIGLLKALGMRRRGITLIYLIEAASIGFWGGLVGVLLAELLGLVANPILTRTLFKGIGSAHILSYPLLYMVMIIFGAVIVGLIAGTLPAIRAGKLDPIEALRRE